MALTPIERLRRHLARKGRRLTLHGTRVVDTVLSLPGTFNEEDVLSQLNSQISRATVVRTLGALMDAAMIRQVQFNGQAVFVAAIPSNNED